jgi:hypothetical protein
MLCWCFQVDIKYNVPSKKGERCDFNLSVKVTDEENGRLISSSASTSTSEKDVRARPKRAIKNKKRKGRKNKKRCRKKNRNKRRKCRRIIKNTPKPPVIQNDDTYKQLVVTICAQ